MKATKWRPALKVTADGKGVVSNAGSRLLAEMADRSGLTDALSEALAPICKRARRHDPGKVLVDVAVAVASGGDALSDVVTLRHQPGVFGAVASVPTAFRVVDAIDEGMLSRIRAARSKVRRSVWGAGLNPVTEHGYVTLDFDGTLVDAHSDKQQAAPTYKKGYGFFPLGTWLDNTFEALAGILRPGNAGANTPSGSTPLWKNLGMGCCPHVRTTWFSTSPARTWSLRGGWPVGQRGCQHTYGSDRWQR